MEKGKWNYLRHIHSPPLEYGGDILSYLPGFMSKSRGRALFPIGAMVFNTRLRPVYWQHVTVIVVGSEAKQVFPFTAP